MCPLGCTPNVICVFVCQMYLVYIYDLSYYCRLMSLRGIIYEAELMGGGMHVCLSVFMHHMHMCLGNNCLFNATLYLISAPLQLITWQHCRVA